MKGKLTALITACALLLMPLGLAACGNKDGKTTVRLSEVTHSIFYAPLYIAINNGYFDDENIDLKLSNGGGADKVMTAVISGSADIGLMGPEATIYCHVEGQRDYPIIFGQLTKRDGSFLVGRTDEGDSFDWASLEGKHILAGRAGGVPAMTLQWVLNRHGVSTDDGTLFDTSVAFDAMVGTFDTDRSIDYTTMFEPTASEYVALGKGYVVASVGEAAGDVPYTAFSAQKSWLNKHNDTAKAFLRAVIRGYKYMTDNTPETVAKALAPSFVGTSETSIAASVVSYLNIDAWPDTPVMSKTSFERLQDIMENAGTLPTRADYNLAVDNTIANLLVEELG
ncbi:MAG: ABC transporter substrate-binding protein [Clostridiales bacterium]|nr:ABC transporter substrate-binding protein [Clostridiales bacterium]